MSRPSWRSRRCSRPVARTVARRRSEAPCPRRRRPRRRRRRPPSAAVVERRRRQDRRSSSSSRGHDAKAAPDFVPAAERIAIVRQRRHALVPSSRCTSSSPSRSTACKALAPQHPEWKTQSRSRPCSRAICRRARRRREGRSSSSSMATHAGMTTDEFDADRRGLARDGAASAVRAAVHRVVYQPMLELLAYLRATASRRSSSPAAASSSCAPGPSRSTAFRPSRSSAAAASSKYELRDGEPVLMRLPEVDFIDDKAGKPVGIQQLIGRRPIFAFGNSDGDFEMLEWTTAGSGPALRRSSSTTPTPSASSPTTATRPSASSTTALDEAPTARLDRRRHEGGLEAHFSRSSSR